MIVTKAINSPLAFNYDAGSPAFANTKSTQFDGVDDYLTTNALSSLVDNKSKLSISFWVNLPDASEINRLTGKYLSLNKWIAIGGYLNGISFAVSGTGTSPSESQAYGVTSAVLTNNTWHHIVCVFDGTQAVNNDRAKIYVDNVDEVLTYNASFPTTTYDFSMDASPPNWLIGQNGIQLGSNELRGMLDEYAIYSDVALTSVEVSEIYNSGVPNDLNTLSVRPDLWYRMGDNDTYPTITDNVGTSDATMINMATGNFIADVPL